MKLQVHNDHGEHKATIEFHNGGNGMTVKKHDASFPVKVNEKEPALEGSPEEEAQESPEEEGQEMEAGHGDAAHKPTISNLKSKYKMRGIF